MDRARRDDLLGLGRSIVQSAWALALAERLQDFVRIELLEAGFEAVASAAELGHGLEHEHLYLQCTRTYKDPVSGAFSQVFSRLRTSVFQLETGEVSLTLGVRGPAHPPVRPAAYPPVHYVRCATSPKMPAGNGPVAPAAILTHVKAAYQPVAGTDFSKQARGIARRLGAVHAR